MPPPPRKKKVAVSQIIHPNYRQVIATYFEPTDYEIFELPMTADGITDLSGLDKLEDLAAVAVQSPNFFGRRSSLQVFFHCPIFGGWRYPSSSGSVGW